MLKVHFMESLEFSVETETLSDFKINNRCIVENYAQLAKTYPDQWIAVLNCAVLDEDADLRKLVERLKANHPADYESIAVEHIYCHETESADQDLFY